MVVEYILCIIFDFKVGIFILKKILNKYNISEIWFFVFFLIGNYGCDYLLFCLILKDVFDIDSRVVFGLYMIRFIFFEIFNSILRNCKNSCLYFIVCCR